MFLVFCNVAREQGDERRTLRGPPTAPAAAERGAGESRPRLMSNEPTAQAAATQRVSDTLAIGYKGADGAFVVTDVLCTNWPRMTDAQRADLSWKLSQWAASYGPTQPKTHLPPKKRERRGIPMPDWKSREGLRQLARLIEPFDRNGERFFHIGFLPLVDDVLGQLVRWTEEASSDELRRRAGEALAERVRFVATQQKQWADINEGFRAMFGDKRGARGPLGIGWLVSTYVRAINDERVPASIAVMPDLAEGGSVADVLGYPAERKSWLQKVAALPDLSPGSAKKWGEVVYERMKMDAPTIMASSEMRGRTSYRGLQRKEQRVTDSDAARFSDFKEAITDAVHTLARKPRGSVPGVTRP